MGILIDVSREEWSLESSRTGGLGAPLQWARRNKEVIGVLVGTVGVQMAQGVMYPVLPLYATEFGVTIAAIGLAVGIFGMGRVVTNLPAGIMADRFGRRVTLASGPAILAIASLLLALSHSYAELVLWRLMQGVGSGMFVTTANVYLVAQVARPDQRARYMSYQNGATLIGFGVGPAVGGFIAEFGIRAPFYFLTVLALATFLWTLTQVREPPPAAKEPTEARGSEQAKAGPSTISGLLHLLSNPSFMLVSFFMAAIFATRAGARQNLVPLHVGTFGFGPAEIGLLFTFGVVAQFLVVAGAGGLSDRFGRKAIILPASVGMALGTAVFLLTGNYVVFALGIMIMQGAEGLIAPVPVAAVTDIAKRIGKPGLAIGLLRTIGDVGFLLGPVVFGGVADVLDYQWGLISAAAFVLVTAFAVVLFARELRLEPKRTEAVAKAR